MVEMFNFEPLSVSFWVAERETSMSEVETVLRLGSRHQEDLM